jgi:hypothetical protein
MELTEVGDGVVGSAAIGGAVGTPGSEEIARMLDSILPSSYFRP